MRNSFFRRAAYTIDDREEMEDSVKNYIDMLIFHTAICAEDVTN